MTIYVVATLNFTDRPAYDRYMAAFPAIFAKHKGTLLAADEAPRVIEGSSDVQKVVIMSFPDEQSLGEWAMSADYQEISKDRRAGSTGPVFLVQGHS